MVSSDNVDFFALDMNPYDEDNKFTHDKDADLEVTSPRAQWLQNELASSTAKFKIVYGHYSPYVSMWVDHPREGQSNYTDTDIPLKNNLKWPYKQWGAHVLFGGDDHFFERNVVDDFTYVVNGFGGFTETPRAMRPQEIAEGNIIHYDTRRGAVRSEVYEDLIKFSFINIDGVVIDEFYIRGDEGGQLASRTAIPGTTSNVNLSIADTKEQKMVVFPNPAENSAVVRITSKTVMSQCQLTIINAQGIVVMTKQIALQKGENIVPLSDIRGLRMSKGLYIVRVNGKDLQLTEKLLIQ